MSLLTQASLIMTPNAIKESKVYSIIPSNGNGDLTFTRGTLASSTLINDAGLVEIVPYNLLTLSESFDNLTAWPNQIGGTGVNATRTPNTVISPNGTLTGDTIIFNRGVGNTSTDQSVIFQTATISPNTDYTFSIWVKASTIGDVGKQVFIRCGGNGSQVAFTLTINWVRIQVSTNITSAGTCYIGSRGGITADNIVSVDLWGGQFNQGTTAKDYFFTTDRLNVPRLNYDTVGGCPSLLLEPQRTNLVFPSATLTTQTRTVTAVSHTLSFYGTGNVVLAGAFIGTLTGTGANNRVTLTFTPTAGSLILTVTGTVTNAQLEAGAYPTSYIPTTSGTVTRNTDSFILNNVYTNNLITSAGGTWFIELNNNIGYIRDAFVLAISLADVSGMNYFALTFGFSSATQLALLRKKIAGVETSIYLTTTSSVKLAIKWNGATADIFANGTKVISATSFTATNLQTFTANGGDAPKFIKSTMLFPSPLTDTECINLTT